MNLTLKSAGRSAGRNASLMAAMSLCMIVSAFAGTTDTEKVIAAMRALKYDFYKGSQYYRACDHQSVQSVLIVESKSKDMKDKNDVFNIVSVEAPNEKNLRTCAELGHQS